MLVVAAADSVTAVGSVEVVPTLVATALVSGLGRVLDVVDAAVEAEVETDMLSVLEARLLSVTDGEVLEKVAEADALSGTDGAALSMNFDVAAEMKADVEAVVDALSALEVAAAVS